METIYFILGMLLISASVIVGALIWGLLKINSMTTQINDLVLSTNEIDRNANLTIEDVRRDCNNMVGELHRRIDNNDDVIHRYVDSRLDKLENKFTSLSEPKDKKGVKSLIKDHLS